MNEQLLHTIALTKLPNVGPITAKRLVDHFGSPSELLEADQCALEQTKGIGKQMALKILNAKQLAIDEAKAEVEFMEEHNIQPILQVEPAFPYRLKQCDDAPQVIFTKGNTVFNNQKVISVVGTRKATNYGVGLCKELIQELAPHHPLIVSGLAYGIDATAHEQALLSGLQTVGVLAHGLPSIHPLRNKRLAERMYDSGGVLTEFTTGTFPEKEHFPRRNRIVAGLSDITVVVESGDKGGSLITARLAQDYNREVAAFPGSIGVKESEGCNELIRSNRAALIRGANDVVELMNWVLNALPITIELSKEQEQITQLLVKYGSLAIDEIAWYTNYRMNELSPILLELEFSGIIKSKPGKRFEMA